MEKTEKKRIRLCAGASAGGHMNQLLKLLERADPWPVHPSFYVTTMPASAKSFEKKGPTYILGECNRYKPLEAFKVILRSFRIIRKEKPDVILTTGSMPIAMFCLVGRLFGAKIIWIDSIANTRRLSMSGRLIRPFAGLILSQWPDVASGYPNVEYTGEII
jgi:UDP-N-acetylglucosamine:LPS N-acetylglucosamine transferase